MTAPFPPLLLVGAGKMGGALYAGWQRAGLAPSVIVDPAEPGAPIRPQDMRIATLAALPADFRPAAVILGVKPQMAAEITAPLAARLPAGTLVLSIMAGLRAAPLSQALGGAPVVRAMPNTPAALGQGMTVCYAGAEVSPAQRDLAGRLMAAVGAVAWVPEEAQIDIVTGISGGGPAYVFLLAELLEQAGAALGLAPDLARLAARQTVAGAGALLAASEAEAAELRRNVTSPNGTTERALAVLMAEEAWPRAVRSAIEAAASRARELGG